MSKIFDWAKLIITNWKTILGLITFLISLTGYQTYQVSVKEDEKIKAVHEVATGFQAQSTESVAAKKPEQCTKCMDEVQKLREEFH